MPEISQSDLLQKIDLQDSMKGVDKKDLLHFQLSLSLMLATTNDIDEGIQRCLDIAMQTAAMQSGIILLIDRAKNEVVHCAHRGLDDLMKNVICCGAVSETGDALHHFNDCRCPYNICQAMSKRFRSFFKLSIFNSGNLLGCMSLASNTTKSIPSTVRVHLKTIAALMGNAIARVVEHQKLIQSRALMDFLMENASSFAVYRLAPDPSRKYKLQQIHISPSIEQIIGCKPEQWTVEDYFDNIHPEDREQVMKAHELAFVTDKFEAVARIYHHAAKKYVWIQATGAAVKNKEGDITHVNGILADVNEKQEALLEVQRKEKILAMKNEKLKQLNTTLNTLLEKRGRDRLELEQCLAFNIKEMVLPYIGQIRNTGSAAKRNRLLGVVEMSLNDISSRLAHSLSTAQYGLTPSEMKIAAFVKQGKSTKEIAKLLGVSEKTVKNQRLAIRKKIGINNKKVNLRTYLQSLQA
jgi:PAS domain S-box-containing protein